MENFESQQFRNELAKEIKDAPKDQRREILDQARSDEGYWEAETRKSKENEEPTEEPLDDGKTVLIHKKTLYHGSNLDSISDFQPAEETTVGAGLYTTSEAKDAIGYARKRAQDRHGEPVIYEIGIEEAKLLDLRSSKNVKESLAGFRPLLVEASRAVKPDAPWYVGSGYLRNIEELDKIVSGAKGASNLRDLTFSCGELFSNYLESLGYDGLIFLEGGEGGDGGPGDHDTYLIFDPAKASVLREHKIL